MAPHGLLSVPGTERSHTMSTTASNQQDRPDDAAIELGVSDEQRDRTVLDLMLCTIDDRIGTIDSVARLRAAGLVHPLGEFVFPTLAARRADKLGAETI
jgi:hypothetical protein